MPPVMDSESRVLPWRHATRDTCCHEITHLEEQDEQQGRDEAEQHGRRHGASGGHTEHAVHLIAE